MVCSIRERLAKRYALISVTPQAVKETYDYIPGFVKHVAKTPAAMDLSALPEGYGFQFELNITDTTTNKSKPIVDKVVLSFVK